jgi:histidinol phosphatase-like enzyme (inositol monophosphatase family)
VAASLRQRLEFAVDAAWQAGKIAGRYFQTAVRPEWKADATPVTVADRESEARLRQLIQQAFPDDGILGEEHGHQPGRSGNRWLLDPIDGTKAFVQGVPLYGVLVAMESPAAVELGVVYMPALDEMVWAGRGEGCWWNGRRAAVSAVARLEEACVCYTDGSSFAAQGRSAAWERVVQRTRLQRGWGDCYGHVLVATGRAEASFDPVMNPWDCAPLLPILEEAGGTFTDWRGRATIHGADAVSTNGLVYVSVMACLQP